MPLWVVLEDAVAGTAADAGWVREQRRRAAVPEPRCCHGAVGAPAAHGGRITDLALVVLTVVVLLVAATAVLLLPGVR